MNFWSDMTVREREAAVIDLVRKQHKSYSQAAKLLGTTRCAVGGALGRAEGRESDATRKERIEQTRPTGGRRAGVAQLDKSSWTEARLTEPWAVWAARRRAARLAMRDKAMTNA